MKFFLYGLVWLFIGPASMALAQQFMLPPPTRQLTEPPGYNLFVGQMAGDAQGRLWLTSDNGMVYVDGQQLYTVRDASQPSGNLYRELVAAPDGRIWARQAKVGAASRLAHFDPVSKRIVSVPDTTRLMREFLSKYGFERLYLDHWGKLWISMPDHGLLRVNPVTLAADPIFPQPITVQALAEGPDGRMWLGTAKGLYAFDPKTGQQQYFQHDPKQPATIGSDNITSIRVRANGDVVIGLYNEVDILTPGTGQVRRVLLPLPTPTSQMWTNAFAPDRFGNDYFSVGLMVCRLTQNGDLQRLNFARPAEKVISIFIQQGHGAEPDRLWVNAAHRLDQYNLSHLRPLPPLNVLDVVVNGVRLIENEQKPEDRFQRDTAGRASLTVQEGDFVQLRFAPFAALKETRFRYKLDGYDQQWTTYTDQWGGATYQPPGGQYTFLFNRAGHGGWEKQLSRIQINVQPSFWKTAWFIALVLVVVSGLIYWGIQTTRRRQKLRQELARQQGEAESLRRLDEFKTQFFANVTHEFRTPLTIILNATESLTGALLNPREHDHLGAIQRNAHQLLRLVNETLDIAKLDAGKLEPHVRLGDPLAFVEQVVDQFRGLAEQKDVTLVWQAERPASVSDRTLYGFDDDKLEKIIYNLLSNALKFTPPGGQVRVDGQITDENQLVVRVADTGIGIPSDQLGRIFERFHQVDASSTRAYSGTGIGLALVKELVEWLGGSVTVDSTVKQGSTFTINLPLDASGNTYPPSLDTIRHPADDMAEWVLNAPPASQNVTAASETDANRKSLVLVVEDNPEMRSYVEETLSAHYQVITAENGRLGLDMAIREVPDLIVSDVMMPELDGYELVERLKADERTSHIPIILLTAKSSYDSRMKGLGVGADDYLGKPFSLTELTLRVGNSLQTRQNWQQWLTSQSPPIDLPSAPSLKIDKEERFLARLRQQILDNLPDDTMDVDWLAAQATMSRTQLHRKLTALTTLSPNRFIHRVRVEKAAELLQTGEMNVTQAAFAVGYSSPSHFAKVFQEHRGYLPARLKV